MKNKFGIFILISLMVIVGCSRQSSIDKYAVDAKSLQITHFTQMYNDVLSNLVAPDHFKWQDGVVGNWDLDWTYDAGGFAPGVLFRAGYDDLANQTLAYVTSLGTLVTKPVEFIVGFGSYADGAIFYPASAYCGLMAVGVNFGIAEALKDPSPIGALNGYICGVAAVVNTAYVDAHVCLNPQLATVGDTAYNEMITRWWDQEKGYFFDPICYPQHQGGCIFSSFQNGTALWALSWHYGIHHDQASLDMMSTLYTSAETHLWNTYWDIYEDLPGFDGCDLGANLLWAMGWNWAYWVTGNTTYLDKVEQILNGIQTHLLKEDAAHPGYKMLIHDTAGSGGGPSTYYCTGCNFLALKVIWNFNDLKANGAHTGLIPIKKPGSCGTLISRR